MKKVSVILVFLIVLMFILGACVPITYSPPTEIHITAGDHVENAAIAVDSAGRSHILGVVADRVVYYRTYHGEPLVKFTLALGGSGTNWKQYNPDIAVLNNGTAYAVWIEQRGTTDKFACYLQIPITPPVGGFIKSCSALDSTNHSTGNIWVTAYGNTAYAVYDRVYTDNVRTTELWYRRLSSTPTFAGRIDWFAERFETAMIYSLDLGIDSGGFLHVGYHYNWTISGTPPYSERLELRSNRSTLADGQMSQVWVIITSTTGDQDIPVSLSFYTAATVERVALASVSQPTTLDRIWIDSCAANGCGSQDSHQVILPSSWNTTSIIEDVEILGIEEYLYLGFIGDDNTAPTGAEQVYYKFDAFSSDPPLQPSSGSATWKYDLEMTKVDARPESAADNFPMMAWGESSIVLNEFFVFEGLTQKVKIYETDCITNLPIGEIGSNGMYFSGVWDDCYDTMFSTQAWVSSLPLILK